MILDKEKNNMTDLAWRKLHERIEKDGLLDIGPEGKRVVRFSNRIAVRWAAAIVLITCATLYITRTDKDSGIDMLSIYNEEQTTLVKTLEDGSVVYLAGGSEIKYPVKFKRNKRVISLKGDAFFEVAKNKKAPFVIETKLMNIEVLGTSFNVKISDPSSTSLSVKTGKVKITLKDGGASGNVSAGETAMIKDKYVNVMPTKDLKQFSNYTDQIHFKDEKLINVVNVINRMSGRGATGLSLEIAPGIEGRLLTATFTENSAESIAKMICIVLNLKYEIKGDLLLIYE